MVLCFSFVRVGLVSMLGFEDVIVNSILFLFIGIFSGGNNDNDKIVINY